MWKYDSNKQVANAYASSKKPIPQSKQSSCEDLMQMASLMGNSALEAYLRQEQAPQSNALTTENGGQELPPSLREQMETRLDVPLDDVRVHYNSDKPASFMARAFTKGNQIYVAPGQEDTLEHELGHVAQQKAGLVRPTGSINGEAVNEDEGLEVEADNQMKNWAENHAATRSIQFMGQPLHNSVVQLLHKEARAKATICEISRNGHKMNKRQVICNGDGYSQSYRNRHGMPDSRMIENKLTNHANKNLRHAGKQTKFLPPCEQEVYKPIETKAVVDRHLPQRTWGNCAEPHAVYEIVKDLPEDKYIHELAVDKAISADDESGRKRHDSEHDERCLNCEQWCSGTKHYLPTNEPVQE